MTTMPPAADATGLFAPVCVVDARCTLGEGPRWNCDEARLYWVDIAERTMMRWHPVSGAVESRNFDHPVGCFAFRESGRGLVLGMKDGCALIDDWAGTPRPLGAQILSGRPDHRMNDGRCDPAGRFWVGSVDGAKTAHDAALYRLDGDGALREIEGGMLTCNGAAFTADGTRFAHADTPSHTLRLYDCDLASGMLSNRRSFHDFPRGVGPGLGRPDGGSFDSEGCYWSALFDGWRVVRLSPDGDILREVRLPVQRPTMIAFGGDDLMTAFVTSATTGLAADAPAAQPEAGGVFAFRVDVPGLPENPFAG